MEERSAIGRSADDVWNQLDPEQQRAARGLLLRLVHPGEGTPDTKRLLSWNEVGTDEPTRLVVSDFADSRLLTADEDARIVAATLTAEADYLCTGDRRLRERLATIDLAPKVLLARELLDVLRGN